MNSYYKGRPATPSPFQKKEPKVSLKKRLSKLIDITIFVLVLLCLVYSLIIKPDPKVIVSSSVFRPASTYQMAAQRSMSSFKDYTKLTFDESSAVSQLQAKYPEIKNASIELPLFGQRPIVRLEIADPQFLFVNKNQNFVLTANGIVIPVSKKDKDTKFEQLPVINDQSGLNAQAGKPVLSSTQVTFIDQVVSQIRNAHVPIASLTLPPTAQEFDLKTKDKPYYIKFYLNGNAATEAGQFLAARHQFGQTHQEPSEYLDVRVAGKIFYK